MKHLGLKKSLPILIVLFAFLLRVPLLSNYPVGFTPDEASFGYDAYSLLETGKDQWGNSWPFTFKSFGDSKLPLYGYLTIPSVAAFGLNEFATRLPSALVGTLAVLATYLVTTKLFKDRRIAYLSSLLLAISPWHLPLSRGAFEANLTVFLMAFGVYAFYRGLKEKKWLYISALSFGINIFSYHSARLVTSIILAVLALWERKSLGIKKLRDAKNYLGPMLVFIAFLGLALTATFSGGTSRAADVTILNPTDSWKAIAERRYEAVTQGVPDQVARIFSNKAEFVLERFTASYLSYLSPRFLFTEGPGEWTYGMIPGRGVLYLFEFAFFAVSIWYLTRKGLASKKGLGFLVFWMLLSPIPAALTKGPGFAANRAAVMMPAVQIFSAFGGILLYDRLKKRFSGRLVLTSYVLVGLLSFAFFLEAYIYHAPIDAAPSMLHGRKEAMEYVESVEDDYLEIVVSRQTSEPQIYVAFYQKWDPALYQEETKDWQRFEEEGLSFLDQLGEYHLGKYTFRNINYSRDKEIPGLLLVGLPREFPAQMEAKKVIELPNGEPAIIIKDTLGGTYAHSN